MRALLAVVLAVLASPMAPIGLARQAEVDPGLSADLPVLALGAAGVLVAVLARAGLAAWWVTRRRGRRRSRLDDPADFTGGRPGGPGRGEAECSHGDPPGPGALARRDRGPGPRPRWSASCLRCAAVAASLAFAASLDHLVRSPALQGWYWDVAVGNPNDEADISPKAELLARNPLVGGYSLVEPTVQRLDIGGTAVPVLGMSPVEGRVLPRVLEGREPRSTDEVALGRATLRRLGRSIGDVVPAQGPGGQRSLRIVGAVLLPAATYDLTMSTGALLTVDGLRVAFPDERPRQFVVEYAPGADQQAAYASLRRDFGPTILRTAPPDEVENLRRVSGLPFLLAALLAVLGAATLGHLLVTSVRRHRRDLAVLKTLGFLRRQVLATVAWQATTLATVALLVGLPIGVAAGRWAWVLVNQGLGSPAGPVTPTLAVLAVVPATILVANLVAALPARAAAATRPAVVLRSE